MFACSPVHRRHLCAGLPRAILERARSTQATLGLDFGSESVRAVLLNCAGGEEIAQATSDYEHRVITGSLPVGAGQAELPPSYCLQHPLDWVNSAVDALAQLRPPQDVNCVGIGVDFTSCTLLPVKPVPIAPGAPHNLLVPLCLLGPEFEEHVHAWPKLWKHHGAARQAEQLTSTALGAGGEQWLRRYGGVLGLEWAFPKALEVFDEDRAVFDAATHFIEAGDWIVHLLLGGQRPEQCENVVRSTCAAGYKACYASGEGFLLSPDVLETAGTGFSAVLDKLRGRHVAPGVAAGTLACLQVAETPRAQLPRAPDKPDELVGCAAATSAAASAIRALRALPESCAALAQDQGSAVTVSAACIDAHAGVVGVGVAEPGTVVCVLGTSACYLVNALPETKEADGAEGIRVVAGVAGAVRDGIIPGLVGYETGQAAVGDSFAWLQRFCGWSWERLEEEAAALPAGAGGVAAVEHFNGCRTPLMDASRRGSLHGLSLSTTPAHVYRALAEASAFGCRWIVELLRGGGVACDRFVATGGLAHKELYRQILADVLQSDISVHPTTQGPARGAAIYGAAAATNQSRDVAELLGFSDVAGAVEGMNRAECGVELICPNLENAEAYDRLFKRYIALVQGTLKVESDDR